jgi:hypothetical protein
MALWQALAKGQRVSLPIWLRGVGIVYNAFRSELSDKQKNVRILRFFKFGTRCA